MLQELERQAEQLQADIAAGQAAFERAGGEAEAAEARVQQLAADIETELATKVSSSRTAALTPTALAQAHKSGGSRRSRRTDTLRQFTWLWSHVGLSAAWSMPTLEDSIAQLVLYKMFCRRRSTRAPWRRRRNRCGSG